MTQRTFIPGEDWLYYKIYCGAKTADIILLEAIKPFMDELIVEKTIDKWFFIRYQDPDYHIRLRMHFLDVKNIGQVMSEILIILNPYVEEFSIHKIQLDTYQRELERYGKNSMEEVEHLFYYDSVCVCEALNFIDNEDLWLLYELKNMDSLLQNFGLNIKSKLVFATQQMEAYKSEFKVTKVVNKQLSMKYRERKDAIFNFFNYLSDEEDFRPLKIIISQKNKLYKPIIDKILRQNIVNKKSLSTDSLLGSLLHMSVNRTFRTKQRMYEMLLYDFLVRMYRGQIGAKKYINIDN